MNTDNSTTSSTAVRFVTTLGMIVGALVVGLGLLILQESGLGGAHIAAIGVALFCSGLIATEWSADQWNLSPADQRKWSLAFAALAGLLLVLFVVINGATFESGDLESGSDGASRLSLPGSDR